MDSFQRQSLLKDKIRTGQPVLGIFIRTPSMHVVEVLATINLDCIVLDAEHAPFSVDSLDQCLMAARAAGIPGLVRLADAAPGEILHVLDMGAAGVIIPHIKSADRATAVVAATRYSGNRGFSASHRAAGYGSVPVNEYIEASDAPTIVIGQIEDAEAVDNIDEIAAVSDLDAIFIGPADLSLSYGVDSWNDPVIEQAIDKICIGGKSAGRTVGMFQPAVDNVKRYREKGVSLFIVSTDQALLLMSARAVLDDFNAICR